MPARVFGLTVVLLAAALVAAGARAQRADAFGSSRDHPAIEYSTAPVTTAVSELNRRLAAGEVRLAFDPVSGYLRSTLDALGIPVESQTLVFSETSFQARKISPENPRAVYFSDSVAVGWVRGGDILEVAAQDPRQGTIFYALKQAPMATPQFNRDDQCLACHLSWDTLAVPGPLVMTVFPRRHDNEYANGFAVDHRVPFAERWGGWYVTGRRVPARHAGNVALLQPDGRTPDPPALASLDGRIPLEGYPRPTSDVVALMVLEHQAHATNLITRAGWEARVGRPERVRQAVADLVDYLLFVDEPAWPHPIEGGSGFAARFAAVGPRDTQGRSLRDLDLRVRLMRYPLSYMIYTPAFDALDPAVKRAVYAGIGRVLAGRDSAPRYAHLSAADRRAIAEIVQATRTDLPDGWPD
ncbi:MAG: hypothetical protein AB1635_16825 [Acidobacteriota bacterium]